MLRILLFSPKGAGNHYYGPGINAYRMYNTLDRDDVQVSLVHGSKSQEQLEAFHEQFFISEIKNKNIFLGIKFLVSAKKWIKENARKFDVVHCLTAFQHSFMFSVWCVKEGVPAFIKIGQSDHTGFSENSIYSKMMGLKTYRHIHANTISGYISISREIEQKLLQAGIQKNKIYHIPNGVDVERFQPANNEEKERLRKRLNIDNCFTVIFTGSFANRKNPYLVAEAFNEFSKNSNHSQLLLLGPDIDGGEQRQKIRDLINREQVTNIHLFGHVKDIENYYRASDLFILPSREEGFSNSMLEAQACGLPAIVTKISGAVDLIDESKNGRFIDRSSESIEKAIQTYLENQDELENHSKNARKIIMDKYSSKQVLNEHLRIFSKVINNVNST